MEATIKRTHIDLLMGVLPYLNIVSFHWVNDYIHSIGFGWKQIVYFQNEATKTNQKNPYLSLLDGRNSRI